MRFQKHAGSVRRFARAMKFGAWLQAFVNKLTPPPFRLVQIGAAFWQSRVIYVAARLDIASALGDAVISAEEIASRVGTDPDATARLMRMLAAMGVFAEVAPRVYGNNRLSQCLRTDHPRNVRAMILMHNADAMSRPWFEHLEQGVRSGATPFGLAHGEELFDYLDHHPGFDQLFSEAMDTVEALAGDSFATDFDWRPFARIIDVGGSRGSKALAILKRHPHLTALVIDRAQVIDEAKRFWAAHGASGVERLQFEAGDLFGTIPAAASDKDVYFLSAVLHGMDDETCVKALHNLARASGSSGARVALLEMVLPEMGTDLAGASFDMQMFMGTRGRERTLAEWKSLVERGGWVLEEVVGLKSFASMLVLLPKRQAA